MNTQQLPEIQFIFAFNEFMNKFGDKYTENIKNNWDRMVFSDVALHFETNQDFADLQREFPNNEDYVKCVIAFASELREARKLVPVKRY